MWVLILAAPALFLYMGSPMLIYFVSGTRKYYEKNLQENLDSLFIFSGDEDYLADKQKAKIREEINEKFSVNKNEFGEVSSISILDKDRRLRKIKETYELENILNDIDSETYYLASVIFSCYDKKTYIAKVQEDVKVLHSEIFNEKPTKGIEAILVAAMTIIDTDISRNKYNPETELAFFINSGIYSIINWLDSEGNTPTHLENAYSFFNIVAEGFDKKELRILTNNLSKYALLIAKMRIPEGIQTALDECIQIEYEKNISEIELIAESLGVKLDETDHYFLSEAMAFHDNIAGQHNMDLKLMSFDYYTNEAYEKLDPEDKIGHRYTQMLDTVLKIAELPMEDSDQTTREEAFDKRNSLLKLADATTKILLELTEDEEGQKYFMQYNKHVELYASILNEFYQEPVEMELIKQDHPRPKNDPTPITHLQDKRHKSYRGNLPNGRR